MLFNKEHPWRFTIGGWGGFVLATILLLIFGSDIYPILGFLTGAILVTIGNVIYVLYTKWKSKEGEK
ncbi:hypothetical protein ACFSKI_16415 [Pseudogracilibacillus auburnensis]|uniref:Uncharacterized protein n=1 Tax=Pseudogracilibacillus auburnensis TaxID=1494959 RepID=A0A2V3WL42_9BACI|nr:hypothetical protein [Pseudogracilibacillus auburnensis]MBO1001627.1 hypothetical protein [Pseudogracilibacillus auburnensis]PXW89449.1 hypothetical protein DFR56_102226 [Pseudogracilibacillus auburnensis]